VVKAVASQVGLLALGGGEPHAFRYTCPVDAFFPLNLGQRLCALSQRLQTDLSNEAGQRKADFQQLDGGIKKLNNAVDALSIRLDAKP
jgi:hypothetical protein